MSASRGREGTSAGETSTSAGAELPTRVGKVDTTARGKNMSVREERQGR